MESMEQSPPQSLSSWIRRHGYALGLFGVFAFSLALRLWSLDRFNQLAFDEVYYVRYGVDYLEGRSLFDAHPPLGKYLIAAGIWLGEHVLFPHLTPANNLFNDASGRMLSPYSYRWLNAVVGSTIPLILAGIARQLTGQRLVGLMAATLIALDGFFLVESRFALLHVYLVAFGLLGNWCWLKALRASSQVRWRWLLGAGLTFGACISVKWNGLGYWLGPMVLWAGAWIGRRVSLLAKQTSPKPSQANSSSPFQGEVGRGLLSSSSAITTRSLASISPLQTLLFLVVLPGLTYTLLWFPHLQLNPDTGLIKLHQQIWGFHQGDSVTSIDIHDYCSPWWSWPLMIRPIAYALSKGGEPPVYFAVYALGNPLLWWGSAGAMAGMAVATVARYQVRLRRMFGLAAGARRLRGGSGLPLGVGLYLLVSFGASWLPWAGVGRCTFVYHYLGALCFGVMALAWWLGWAWQLRGDWRLVSAVVGGMVAIAFLFWLPIWLGLPLSEQAFQLRLLLPSWP